MKQSVDVVRSDLVQGLEPFTYTSFEYHGEEALIWLEGFDLMVSLFGITSGFPALGTWQGEVRIPGKVLMMLTKQPPRSDPLKIQVLEGRFRVGSFSSSCKIQKAWRSESTLPIDANLSDIINFGLIHTQHELELTGYKEVVENADKQLDLMLEECVLNLQELHISPPDLMCTLRNSMKELIRRKKK